MALLIRAVVYKPELDQSGHKLKAKFYTVQAKREPYTFVTHRSLLADPDLRRQMF